MSVVIPGSFESKESRLRGRLSSEMAVLLTPYLERLGWATVANDLLSLACGIVSTGSDSPQKHLDVAGVFVRRYNWRRAKKLMFAAKNGVRPEDVSADEEDGTAQGLGDNQDAKATGASETERKSASSPD